MRYFLLLFLLTFKLLYAHPINTTNIELYLNRAQPTLDLSFSIFNLKPLLMLKNDPNKDVVISKKSEVLKYIQQSITIKNNNTQCKLQPQKSYIENEITYKGSFLIRCSKPLQKVDISFNLFFEFDKTQEGVMQIITPKTELLFVFSPHQSKYTILLSNNQQNNFIKFIIEGIWHIWEGVDHLLFLFMLIAPALLIKTSFKATLTDIFKIVTAFTFSHSLTLFLSMLKIIIPPQQLIETLIALSVLITALNNIYPIVSFKKEWLIAFGFGFIHGFGFANALSQIDINQQNFLSALFGFNLGVEIGQIVIILLILPILYKLSCTKYYKSFFVIPISLVVANIALLWAIERAFNLNFMPF